MTTTFTRADRVSGLIQKVLSDVLKKNIKDPRLKMITITDVKMSRDLKLAKIYYNNDEGYVEFGEVFLIRIEVNRGSSRKYSIDIYVESEDGVQKTKVSEVTELNIPSQNDEYEFKVAVPQSI